MIASSSHILARNAFTRIYITATPTVNHHLTTRHRQRYTTTHASSSSSSSFILDTNNTTTVKNQEWQRSDLHVVLVHPQIPQNAGNIARTCAATSISLHLVAPLGFELDNTKLKRAGLDYWDFVCCKVHPSWEEFHTFFKSLDGNNKMFAFSKFGKKHHATENTYTPGTWLLFGAETTGLPDEAHHAAVESGGDIVKIPMSNYQHVRSLNLATSVGIGVFEALRQLDGAILPEDIDIDSSE